MHELTIAQNIITIVEEEIRKQSLAGSVTAIYFKAGRLNAIIPETLQFGFNAIKRESPRLSEAKLIVEEIPVRIRCEKCHSEKVIDEPVFFCENCGSQQITMLSGQEMYIDNFEIE